jgi:hypothetical protein
VLVGIAEVIRLLHKRQFHPLKVAEGEVPANTSLAEDSDDPVKIWTISEADEQKIYELYSDKAILEIIPSQREGYCLIKMQDKDGPLNPYIKIVDVSGIGAREVHDETIRKEIMHWYEEEEAKRG